MKISDVDRTLQASLATAETLFSPALRPEPLDDPEQRRLQSSIHAALFGDPGKSLEIGRYRLLNRLGEGGMGVVYAAYDERLDRKVALKLILPSQVHRAEAHHRILLEGRAMARLSHPNVAHVYEIGEYGEQIFVAMEFLAGPTLRSWMDERTRSWHEVLGVFLQAGEGLAAAHREGIVHRDFKPHNAIFGADGRLRVLDFGLARLGDAHEQPRSIAPSQTPVVALTATGAVLGTPAYMAPEQFAGLPADARSDQFSFCVALHEALYGDRPFTGDTLAALAVAVTTGDVRARPPHSDVPEWIHTVVRRGLHSEPSQRWPSIDSLLVALSGEPRIGEGRLLRSSKAIAAVALAPLLVAPFCLSVTGPVETMGLLVGDQRFPGLLIGLIPALVGATILLRGQRLDRVIGGLAFIGGLAAVGQVIGNYTVLLGDAFLASVVSDHVSWEHLGWGVHLTMLGGLLLMIAGALHWPASRSSGPRAGSPG